MKLPQKITINDMINSKYMSSKNRVSLIHKDLKNRISYKIMRLENMPYGLGQMQHIKEITNLYIKSFEDLHTYYKNKNITNYNTLLKNIYDRHSSTFSNISKGIFEWKRDLDNRYGIMTDFFNSKDIKNITEQIDNALNIFYQNRTSTRLIIAQHLDLKDNKKDKENNIIGSVQMDMNPIRVMVNGWNSAKLVSEREYGFCPNLSINGEDILLTDAFIDKFKHLSFPYIPMQMRNIFFEIFKNSIRATIDKYGCNAEDNSNMINIAFNTKTSNTFSAKISDKGYGIKKENIDKIWSYFYTTAPNNILQEESIQHIDFSGTGPLSGLGYGLPITKLMINYFGGDININSLENVGTDVNLYF